jgi:molybdenum cofactor cytidylyltransferase
MIGAVIPAAGRSRRMGTQKLLLPWGESSLIAHVVDQVRESVVERICVVVGRDGEAIAQELSGRRLAGLRARGHERPLLFVTSPEADSEMLDSVRLGLRALPEGCEAILVALGDQPGITSTLIDEMVRAWRVSGKGIVVPRYGGRRGHPLLFSAHYCEAVLTGHDETGLRGLVQDHAEDLHEVDVATPAVLSDIDRPEDYRRALEAR